MLIADAQIHLWAADRLDRPWPPGGAHRVHKPYPVSKDMALAGMKEAGVDRAVIVPPSWEGERNDLALEVAGLHPDRLAVMGRFPLEKPESRPLVEGWRRQPGMLGMRFTFNTEQQTEAYPFADVHPHIRRVYDAFGPRRMFWGTDWTRLPYPWRQAVTLFTEEIPWLSSSDKEWIMGRAICEWLGWPMPRST